MAATLLAAHTARVCGRCEDSRRLSTCEDRAHCAGLCNSTMHVDYNAFRHCSWCTTARNDISSRVTFAVRGTHRSQSMLPAAWRFRGTATSSTVRREPLANDDAPGSAHPQASGMPICSLSDPSACNCHLGPTICVELAAEELATASAQLPLDVQRFHVIPPNRCGAIWTTAAPGGFIHTGAECVLAACTARHAALRSFHLHLHVFALCSALEWDAVGLSWPLIWLRSFFAHQQSLTSRLHWRAGFAPVQDSANCCMRLNLPYM